jgi:hypothetical protein
MGTCQKCGKTVSLRELSNNYGRCQDCFQKECSEYEYWKARQLSSPDVINKKGNNGKKCSECFFSKTKQNSYSELEICSKFQISIALRQELAETCSSYFSESDCEKKGLSREMNKEKESVQVILDFSSLRDVMTKTGITMTKFECPSCHGIVKIPEAGNIIICQYCRTPIRPNEIFKKISLI